MFTYYLQVTDEFGKCISVEADSEEEAKDIAREIFEYYYSSQCDSLELKAEEM